MRYKLKEILIVVFIILITLFLAFYPKLEAMLVNEAYISNDSNDTSSNTNNTTHSKYVYITLEGEITVDSVKIKIPYGYSYGNIINTIKLYTNRYSIIDYDSKQRFTCDTTITILSTDVSKDIDINLSNKININTASKNELITLYGIGEKRAEYIIEYRNTKNITSFDELKKIIGVSNAVIEKIKEQAIL